MKVICGKSDLGGKGKTLVLCDSVTKAERLGLLACHVEKLPQSLPGLGKVEGSFAALHHCCSSGRGGLSVSVASGRGRSHSLLCTAVTQSLCDSNRQRQRQRHGIRKPLLWAPVSILHHLFCSQHGWKNSRETELNTHRCASMGGCSPAVETIYSGGEG